MPRRKKDAAPSSSSSGAAAPAAQDAGARPAWREKRDESQELGDVQQLLEALADAGERIVIMRQRGDRFAYVTTIAAGSFSLEWVKRNLGGGVFRANAIVPGPKGDRMATTATFAIEGPAREYARDSDGSPLEAPPTAPAAPANPTADMSAAMMGMAMQAMQGMASAFAAMAKSQQAPAPPQVDPLAVLEKAASIFRHEQRTTPASEIASAIREGMELAHAAGAGGDGGRAGGGVDPTMAAIAPAIGPLAGALASRLEAETEIKRAQAARFGARAPVPAGAPPAAAPPAGGDAVTPPTRTIPAPTFGDWRDQLTPLAPYLVGLARKRANPRAEAVRMLDDAPARVVTLLVDQVNADPEFVAHLLDSFPAMREASVADWFREFVAAVDSEVRDDPDADHADDHADDE